MEEYSKEYIKEKFIEMAHEFTNLIMKIANEDIGEIIMVNEDIKHRVIIGRESKVEMPSRYYPDIIDIFNGTIWPKYPYIKNITFYYFSNVKMMDFTIALCTEVLIELKTKVKELDIEYQPQINQIYNNYTDYEKVSKLMKIGKQYRRDLEDEMDKLILKYIKKYDKSINDIETFKIRYEDTYDFLHYRHLDKFIENLL